MGGVFEDNRRYRVAKTLVYLFLLACIYLPICIFTMLKNILLCRGKSTPKKNMTIVITGAKMYKSTMFVKWLGRAGYDIVLVETEKFWCSGSRFSKYVKKFYTMSCALKQPEQYVKDLVKICKDNKAHMFIPVCAPATEKLDAIVGEQLQAMGIKVLHAPDNIFEKLNDKHQFSELCKELDLAIPESFLVESEQDVYKLNEKLKERARKDGEKNQHKHVFVLKNIEYDPVHRLDLFTLPNQDNNIEAYLKKIARDGNAINAKQPWQVQRFIDGVMWSSLQIQVDGEVCLFTSELSSASQFNWKHEENEQIKAWNQKFAKNMKISGIFTNDFIVDKHDGVAYAIECNPRLGSQVSLFHQNKDMAAIILGEHPQKKIEPASQKSTFTTFNEIFVLIDPQYYAEEGQNVSFPERLTNFLNAFKEGCDPIFDEEDLLPFFMINFFQMPCLLIDTAIANRPWKKIDFQIGKVVELGGY